MKLKTVCPFFPPLHNHARPCMEQQLNTFEFVVAAGQNEKMFKGCEYFCKPLYSGYSGKTKIKYADALETKQSAMR